MRPSTSTSRLPSLSMATRVLPVPAVTLLKAWTTVRPAYFSPTPSKSCSAMSPPVVVASSSLTAISSPAMPVAARTVRRCATTSTAASAKDSATAPWREISVTRPAELRLCWAWPSTTGRSAAVAAWTPAETWRTSRSCCASTLTSLPALLVRSTTSTSSTTPSPVRVKLPSAISTSCTVRRRSPCATVALAVSCTARRRLLTLVAMSTAPVLVSTSSSATTRVSSSCQT